MTPMYVRLTRGLADKGQLIKPDEIWDKINTSEKDWYISLFHYNNEHKKIFDEVVTNPKTNRKEPRGVSGITDVTTDKIWFDFDAKDVEKSRQDAITLVKRLKEKNIQDSDIEVYFTGSKGFHVLITLAKTLKPIDVQRIAKKYAGDLETFDLSLYDAPQLLRVPGTKHQTTGLYKIPLTVDELNVLSVDNIKNKAKSLDNISGIDWGVVNPTQDFFDVPLPPIPSKNTASYSLDLSRKPSQWRNCKWSLLQGNFKEGQRHEALMVLAATGRGMNFDKDTAYYICKAALKKQAERTGQDEFDKEELYNNIIESTYRDNWQGGQYTCQKEGWLQDYCHSLDSPCEKHSDSNLIKIEDAFDMFKNYATNIDNLTIKTGIPVLDKKLKMTVGMSVGIVAPPGVGKTSIALQILNNMSKNNEQAVFLSYDMFHALVFQKLIQKHFHMQPDDIFERFKARDYEFQEKTKALIQSEYKNIHFCFKAGQTYSDILDTINEAEDTSGKKVKLLVCDYNELVLTDMSDSTSSSNYVAQKMREIANVKEMCVLSLFQPNKVSGTPSDEILSYRAAKGGSGIEQSVSVMLGMSRPGYNPRKPEMDKFMSINCLKNRMGSLFAVDLGWNGLAGSLSELSDEEQQELSELRRVKDEEKNGDKKWD